jgi:hypothetical protein
MKNNRVLLFSTVMFLFLTFFSVFMMHIWEYNQVLRADQRIVFTKLLGKEHVSDKLLSHLYRHVKEDYCRINETKENIIFKYTLGEQLNFLNDEIEDLFKTVLKSQHGQEAAECA